MSTDPVHGVKNCNQAIPTDMAPYTPKDEALLAKAQSLQLTVANAIASQSIQKYVKAMISMICHANKYIDDMELWVLRKTNVKWMKTVLYVILEVLRCTAILYQPLIPESSNQILDLLAIPPNERTFDDLDAGRVEPGAPISKPVGVFPRLEWTETMEA